MSRREDMRAILSTLNPEDREEARLALSIAQLKKRPDRFEHPEKFEDKPDPMGAMKVAFQTLAMSVSQAGAAIENMVLRVMAGATPDLQAMSLAAAIANNDKTCLVTD